MITKFGALRGFFLSLLCVVLSLPVFAGKSSVLSRQKETIREVLQEIRMEEASQTEVQKQARTLYDEGFTLTGADNTLKIGAWMQNDARIFMGTHPGNTQFLLRRARMDLRGAMARLFTFRLMGEFEGDNGTNAANLKEGWVEYSQFPGFRVRLGQYKPPFGLENLSSDLWLDFMERAVGENFIRPEQELGLMLLGKLFKNRLEYGVSLSNGSGHNIIENNDAKDVAGRLALTPFAPSSKKWINQISLGVSSMYGKQNTTLDAAGPSTAAGTRLFAFVNPTAGNDVTVNDYRLRLGGDLQWTVGPFSFKTEYAMQRLSGLNFGGVNRNWILHGHDTSVSWVVTGEDKSNQHSVNPRHPFDPKEGQWGALELASRFEILHADQGLIDAGFAAGTDDLWSTTAGVNWYLNSHVRVTGNYVFSKFDDAIANAGAKDSEHVLLFRGQFNL